MRGGAWERKLVLELSPNFRIQLVLVLEVQASKSCSLDHTSYVTARLAVLAQLRVTVVKEFKMKTRFEMNQ